MQLSGQKYPDLLISSQLLLLFWTNSDAFPAKLWKIFSPLSAASDPIPPTGGECEKHQPWEASGRAAVRKSKLFQLASVVWRSSYSTLSLPLMTELITLSRRTRIHLVDNWPADTSGASVDVCLLCFQCVKPCRHCRTPSVSAPIGCSGYRIRAK